MHTFCPRLSVPPPLLSYVPCSHFNVLWYQMRPRSEVGTNLQQGKFWREFGKVNTTRAARDNPGQAEQDGATCALGSSYIICRGYIAYVLLPRQRTDYTMLLHSSQSMRLKPSHLRTASIPTLSTILLINHLPQPHNLRIQHHMFLLQLPLHFIKSLHRNPLLIQRLPQPLRLLQQYR